MTVNTNPLSHEAGYCPEKRFW